VLLTRTRTIKRTVTRLAPRASAGQTSALIARGAVEAPEVSGEAMDDIPGDIHALFGRHLCPRCPRGVSIGAGRTGAVSYCCPRRKTKVVATVTRTSVKTKYLQRTTTAVARMQVLRGLVFGDRNGNSLRDAGEPPIPGAGVSLFKELAAMRGRRVRTLIARTTTGAKGGFRFVFRAVEANVRLIVVRDAFPSTPLLNLSAREVAMAGGKVHPAGVAESAATISELEYALQQEHRC